MSAIESFNVPEAKQASGVSSLLSRGLTVSRDVVTQREHALVLAGLLLIVLTALFHRVLQYAPSDANDLRLLSSVARTDNPLVYLVGDWGEAPYETGNYGMYRPIHPISLWLVYRVFGVRAFPNQLINLALHFANALLLLWLLLRVQSSRAITFLCAALFLVSVYTVSPAIWVTDRATLQVGLALLLLLNHIASARENDSEIHLGYVALLSVFALLSKESGLIVPLVGIVAAIRMKGSVRKALPGAMVLAGIVGLYFGARFLMFGSSAASYSKGGYLFGVVQYERVSDLPVYLQWFSLGDNLLKNLVAPWFPLFAGDGKLQVFSIVVLLGVAATVSLMLLSTKGRITEVQLYGVIIIVLNALVHFQIFRFRILYLAQIGLCLFIAAGPGLTVRWRRNLATVAAGILLLVSVIRVDDYVQTGYMQRYRELNEGLSGAVKRYPGRIEQSIIKDVVSRYGKPETAAD